MFSHLQNEVAKWIATLNDDGFYALNNWDDGNHFSRKYVCRDIQMMWILWNVRS